LPRHRLPGDGAEELLLERWRAKAGREWLKAEAEVSKVLFAARTQ